MRNENDARPVSFPTHEVRSGIQGQHKRLDSRFRGNDNLTSALHLALDCFPRI